MLYCLVHWILLIVETIIFSLIILTFFGGLNIASDTQLELLYLSVVIAIYLEEKLVLQSGKIRRISYYLTIVASVAAVLTSSNNIPDLFIIIGTFLLFISLLFPILVGLTIFLDKNSPPFKRGRLTPFVLSFFSFLINFSLFALIS
jgi:hypothetical protein